MADYEDFSPGLDFEQARHLGELLVRFGLDVGLVEIEVDAVDRDAAVLAQRAADLLGRDEGQVLLHGLGLEHLDDGQHAALQGRRDVTARAAGLGRDIDRDVDVAPPSRFHSPTHRRWSADGST